MKLNLGCGEDIKDGYVNVDRRDIPGVTNVDLSVFPWPFKDESAEEILMLDFLEHFPYRMTNQILLEVNRVLVPDGTVVIQVPDTAQLMRAIDKVGDYYCNRCGEVMGLEHREEVPEHCPKCGQSADDIAEAAMMRLFGGQDYPGNFHFTCFTRNSLNLKASRAGLTMVAWEEVTHQSLNWNFKTRYQKGDPWANS